MSAVAADLHYLLNKTGRLLSLAQLTEMAGKEKLGFADRKDADISERRLLFS
jgi:hypothetical protein